MASIKNRPKLAATQSKQAKNSTSPKATLQPFMQENIDRMHRLGKVRTGETYTCTLNSFMRFRQGKDVFWEDFYNPQIEMFARFKMKSSFHKTKRII